MGKKKKKLKAREKMIAGIKSRMYFFTAIVAILITWWTIIWATAYADLEVYKQVTKVAPQFKSSWPVGFVLDLHKPEKTK